MPGAGVLIVDDTEEVRLLLRLALERDGDFEVLGEAADGKQAIELSRALQPDLVLLDLAMPVLDGMRALPEIKRVAPHSRVVVLSAFEEQAVGAQARKAGATAYIQKGLPIRVLVARLREACDLRPATSAPIASVPATSVPQPTIDFLSVTAHELRNPISVVQGFAEALVDDWDDLDDPSKRDMASKVLRHAGRMRRLVEDLLVVSRLDGGTLAVDLRPVPLDSIVYTAIESVDPGAAIQLELPAQSPVVVADPGRMEQVLINLVTNALRHGGAPVTIQVAQGPPGSAIVSVIDNGPGIPLEARHHLFQRFSELARGKPGSTGLGLYIVSALMKAQGGTIAYEDRGNGACFSMEIPLAHAARAAVA